MRKLNTYSVEEIERLCKLAKESPPPFMPKKVEYEGKILMNVYEKAKANLKE